jgi:hypothetical protein
MQQYFSYIVAVSFIGGGNWSTRRNPPTYRKSLTTLSPLIGILSFVFLISQSKGCFHRNIEIKNELKKRYNKMLILSLFESITV